MFKVAAPLHSNVRKDLSALEHVLVMIAEISSWVSRQRAKMTLIAETDISVQGSK